VKERGDNKDKGQQCTQDIRTIELLRLVGCCIVFVLLPLLLLYCGVPIGRCLLDGTAYRGGMVGRGLLWGKSEYGDMP
jgi:hypothetical protein